MYNLLSGISPDAFGAGANGGFGGFMQRWGTGYRQTLNDGMTFGKRFYDYGAENRLAPFQERNAYQDLNTNLVKSQNDQMNASADQTVVACNLVGWNTPQCQALRAQIDGRVMTNTQNAPYQPARPNMSVLGIGSQFDSEFSGGGF